MAGFGRSNSLSINTGGGLFGNNAAQNQATTQPQSSGGLFGSTQPKSGSLFGAKPAASQPQSGGLFGTAANTTTAAPSGGLFGASTAQNQTQSGAQSGGLFGGATQAKPSLFGASTQQQQATTPSLFGSAAVDTQTQQTQPAGTSLFGATQQQQPQQQQNTLFGGMNNQNRPTTFGGGLGTSQLGASGQQAVQTTLDNIKGTTRFNDLHPDLQNLIQQFDEGIQRKINFCTQIRETLPGSGSDVASIGPDVALLETKLATIEVGLDNDSRNIAHLREVVKKDAADAALSFRAIENQRLPAQFHYRNSSNNLSSSTAKTPATNVLDDDDPTKPVDLMNYFNRRTDDLGRTLDVYQGQIREIEAHLRTMEAGTIEKAQQLTGSRSGPRDQRRELIEALKGIEGAILESAKKVGKARDHVTKQTMGSVGAALL